MQTAMENIVRPPPEVPSIAYMNYTIEDVPVAALNPEHRMSENRQVFLADVQVSGLPLNLLVGTGSYVPILNKTFPKLDNICKNQTTSTYSKIGSLYARQHISYWQFYSTT